MKRSRVRVYGIVQGVGFRPFVARIAEKSGVAGNVCNKGPFVEIFIEGSSEQIEIFLKRLEGEAPERSSILKIEKTDCEAKGEKSFRIIESEKVKGDIFVSPDIAICEKCKKELFDKNDRRYLHPFINCTACGPRLTILDSMPYDRARTSMGVFPMCAKCEYEYTSPSTRRYHAQPVCCPDCGPALYIIGTRLRGADAIIAAREKIRGGGIVAVKGIGGFHLCCDATSARALSRLRELKRRPFKPFAVMMKNIETVERECVVLEDEKKILDGPQKPILLLEKKQSGKNRKLRDEVAPGNPNVGAMLPYAPVQLLLFDFPDKKNFPDCLVMTSGNPRGAPICRTDEEAQKWLSPMCDMILSNDRTIRIRADDSVMAWRGGKPMFIRRSRGYAPLPVSLSRDFKKCVLAVGGELKNTFCVSKNNLHYLSPYIGDMADARSVDALKAAIARMETLLEAKPEAVACDLHPKYNTVAVAEETGLPIVRVQHHHAHIASCLAENDWRDKCVAGVSFDGTGFGADGSVWGGEFLIASYDDFRRAGSIEPFTQAGGDASAKECWRIAAALLDDLRMEALSLADGARLSVLRQMMSARVNCAVSTSAGRLFDAVGAILGLKTENTFEGETAMATQACAERAAKENGADIFNLDGGVGESDLVDESENFFTLRTASLVRAIAERKISGESAGVLALDFHAALARMVAAGCEICRAKYGTKTVAMSGGVFQNSLLLDMCAARLEKAGFSVLTHSVVPANDGGLALGQAAVAMEKLSRG